MSGVSAIRRLHLPSYVNRTACADNEAKGDNVMGVSGEGKCVYYPADPAPMRWERVNDGECEASADPLRAKWPTQQACEAASKQAGFVCVQSPTPGRQFCSSAPPGGEYGPECPSPSTNLTCVKARFSSLAACQAQCFVSAG